MWETQTFADGSFDADLITWIAQAAAETAAEDGVELGDIKLVDIECGGHGDSYPSCSGNVEGSITRGSDSAGRVLAHRRCWAAEMASRASGESVRLPDLDAVDLDGLDVDGLDGLELVEDFFPLTGLAGLVGLAIGVDADSVRA